MPPHPDRCPPRSPHISRFVNVSPVDANLDETQNSLQYAQRVSTIRNDVSKNENSTEVLKLKKQIDYWKEQAGLPPHKRDYVDLEEIQGGWGWA